MKIVELTNKLLLPLNNEEQELLERFSNGALAKSELDEREQVLANQLTNKDVLLRKNEDGKIHYSKKID